MSAIVGLHIEEANTVGPVVRLSPYAVLIYLSFDLPLDLMLLPSSIIALRLLHCCPLCVSHVHTSERTNTKFNAFQWGLCAGIQRIATSRMTFI